MCYMTLMSSLSNFYRYVLQRQQREVSKCCWMCEKCAANAIITSDQVCQECEKGFWPNSNLTGKPFILLMIK